MHPQPEITEDQAIALSKTNWWVELTDREVAIFQVFTPLLCMPFGDFHEAVEKAIGRPVWTHEFGLNLDGLKRELLDGEEPPTLLEIMEMIPAEKRIVITTATTEKA